jgi:hypothetical protein
MQIRRDDFALYEEILYATGKFARRFARKYLLEGSEDARRCALGFVSPRRSC